MNRFRTDFLFAQPSFGSGLARVLDLFGLFDSYNESPKPAEADARAIYSDWAMIGQDLIDSAEQLKTELKNNNKQLALNF